MSRTLGLFMLALAVGGAQPALAQVKFEHKYRPNSKSSTVEAINLTQTLKIAGMNVDTSSDTKITVLTEMLTPAENLVPIKTTYEAITFNANIAGQNLTFDSAKPNEKAANPAFEPALDAMRAMTGASITYQVGADGKVSRVDGLQAIISKAPASVAKALEDRLSEARLKEEFNQQASVLPDTPVNKGDTWKRTYDMNIEGGQTLSFDRIYEYAGTIDKDGKKLEQIKVKDEACRYMIGANDQNLSVKDSDLKVESSEGAILFDRELGAVVDRNLTSRITGKMTLQINGMDLPTELDLKLTQSSTQKK